MAKNDQDHLAELIGWLIEERASIDIAGHIALSELSTAQGKRTKVAIDHLLACPLESFGGWRVTTKRMLLPRGHFASQPAHYLKTADHARGRTIYCQDLLREGEVIAALSYHVDERASWPLFITRIGFRVDFRGQQELRRRTIAGAFLLKQYVHAISDALGRGGDVHIDLPPPDADTLARELGFRNARRIKHLKVAGQHMCQPPLRRTGG